LVITSSKKLGPTMGQGKSHQMAKISLGLLTFALSLKFDQQWAKEKRANYGETSFFFFDFINCQHRLMLVRTHTEGDEEK